MMPPKCSSAHRAWQFACRQLGVWKSDLCCEQECLDSLVRDCGLVCTAHPPLWRRVPMPLCSSSLSPCMQTTLPLGYDAAAELWGMQGSSPLSAYSVAHLADDKPAALPHPTGAGRVPILNGASPAAVNSAMCGGVRQPHQQQHHLEKAGSSNASTQGDEMLEGCSPRSEDSQQLILCKQIWQNS